MKERIKKLLASGMKGSEIASVVGCSPGYVSQLLSDPEFKASVEAEMVAAATENTEEEHLDRRYQTTEHRILNHIQDAIAGAELPALTRALEVIGKRQSERRREQLPAVASPTSGVNIHITQIALPSHAVALPAPIVSTNEKNEIIAIDSRPLAPMSSDGVKNIFAQIKEKKEANAKLVLAGVNPTEIDKIVAEL